MHLHHIHEQSFSFLFHFHFHFHFNSLAHLDFLFSLSYLFFPCFLSFCEDSDLDHIIGSALTRTAVAVALKRESLQDEQFSVSTVTAGIR
jgi:hypothetical protein